MSPFPTLLDLIGNTPLVRLQKLTAHLDVEVLVKLEMYNPGYSVKDRIGLRLIEAAERDGLLKPGGTIVEPTSGNTGVGLAMAAIAKGYRCVFVMPDKMSDEKINLLRAYGAEVVICPTAVEADDPRSYYRVSDRLARELPNAFKPDQYANMANPQTHYETTGPELWQQVDGRLDAFVCGVGTGGTMTGIGKYLKERDPNVTIVGADPEGSIYTTPEDQIHPYLVEGVGEDFWPGTFDRSVVDEWIKVGDAECFEMCRRLAREEGILSGGSCGLAMVAALRKAETMNAGERLVVLLPDSGRSYLSKVYNPDWLLANGMIDEAEHRKLTYSAAQELLDTPVEAKA
jgi:cystathionine beta-synthase